MKVFALLLLVPMFGALKALIVQWLWNHIMPDLFELPLIGFWQAWGLMILGGLLFAAATNFDLSSKETT